MPNKQLTAKVKLNITDAENKLKQLEKRIKQVNKATNNINQSRAVNTQLQRQLTNTNKIQTAVNGVKNNLGQWKNKISQSNAELKKFTSGLGGAKTLTNSIWGTLKGVAATYLGIMGARNIINTSDTLVSAENRLNNVNAVNMGDKAFTADGGYSSAVFDATTEAMDKMYTSAQKVHMSYTDMMSSVSKNMTLAGGAFQNNIDTAIRFQEIMAESYALGGASAEEMSSSMYQLTQALASGTLAGDELRSVREGAPLAYKAIEEFAQKVWDTDESLKELGSQGKVTSDMVVAAIMDIGESTDKAFAQTQQTFGQTLDQIKNAAVNAFRPISDMLSEELNQIVDDGMVEKLEETFIGLSNGIQTSISKISDAISWISDNWKTVESILITGATTVGIIMITTALSSAIAWIAANWAFLLIVVSLFAIIYLLYQFQQGAITVGQLLVGIFTVVAIAIMIIGLVMGSTVTFMIGLAILALVVLAANSASVTEFIMNLAFILLIAIVAVMAVVALVYIATGILIMSTTMLVVLLILGIILLLVFAFMQFGAEISGIIYAAVAVIWNLFLTLASLVIKSTIVPMVRSWDNFANFFGNLFVDPIAAIIRLFENLADGVLSILHTIAQGIDSIFGSNLADTVNGWRKGLSGKADELVAKYGNGKYEEKSNLADQLESMIDDAQQNWALEDATTAYDVGHQWGTNILNKIDGLGSHLNFSTGRGVATDGDFVSFKASKASSGGKPNLPSLDDAPVGSSYKMPSYDDLKKGVDNIDTNTGKISDSMDLTNEDMEYLRKVAEMEWKKEYTTANITVDMTNNNQINGDGDLDGIVTKLADKLYEEMDYMANGVYAY